MLPEFWLSKTFLSHGYDPFLSLHKWSCCFCDCSKNENNITTTKKMGEDIDAVSCASNYVLEGWSSSWAYELLSYQTPTSSWNILANEPLQPIILFINMNQKLWYSHPLLVSFLQKQNYFIRSFRINTLIDSQVNRK